MGRPRGFARRSNAFAESRLAAAAVVAAFFKKSLLGIAGMDASFSFS
jgi:hypothetical protein